MTPANSEAPREAVGELGLLDRYDALRERAEDRHELTIDALPTFTHTLIGEQAGGTVSTKVSSPELASLAAKYVHMRDSAMAELVLGDDNVMLDFFVDVRALAASVLSQAEGTPRK